MTQYEILQRVPTGLKVAIYEDGQEVVVLNVPATQCKTIAMFEGFLRRIAADHIKKMSIPTEVESIKGRRVLR